MSHSTFNPSSQADPNDLQSPLLSADAQSEKQNNNGNDDVVIDVDTAQHSSLSSSSFLPPAAASLGFDRYRSTPSASSSSSNGRQRSRSKKRNATISENDFETLQAIQSYTLDQIPERIRSLQAMVIQLNEQIVAENNKRDNHISAGWIGWALDYIFNGKVFGLGLAIGFMVRVGINYSNMNETINGNNPNPSDPQIVSVIEAAIYKTIWEFLIIAPISLGVLLGVQTVGTHHRRALNAVDFNLTNYEEMRERALQQIKWLAIRYSQLTGNILAIVQTHSMFNSLDIRDTSANSESASLLGNHSEGEEAKTVAEGNTNTTNEIRLTNLIIRVMRTLQNVDQSLKNQERTSPSDEKRYSPNGSAPFTPMGNKGSRPQTPHIDGTGKGIGRTMSDSKLYDDDNDDTHSSLMNISHSPMPTTGRVIRSTALVKSGQTANIKERNLPPIKMKTFSSNSSSSSSSSSQPPSSSPPVPSHSAKRQLQMNTDMTSSPTLGMGQVHNQNTTGHSGTEGIEMDTATFMHGGGSRQNSSSPVGTPFQPIGNVSEGEAHTQQQSPMEKKATSLPTGSNKTVSINPNTQNHYLGTLPSVSSPLTQPRQHPSTTSVTPLSNRFGSLMGGDSDDENENTNSPQVEDFKSHPLKPLDPKTHDPLAPPPLTPSSATKSSTVKTVLANPGAMFGDDESKKALAEATANANLMNGIRVLMRQDTKVSYLINSLVNEQTKLDHVLLATAKVLKNAIDGFVSLYNSNTPTIIPVTSEQGRAALVLLKFAQEIFPRGVLGLNTDMLVSHGKIYTVAELNAHILNGDNADEEVPMLRTAGEQVDALKIKINKAQDRITAEKAAAKNKQPATNTYGHK